MRVGILTFHCAYNYGAMLQCYALQESLAGIGADVSVIDYRPAYLATRPVAVPVWSLISPLHPQRSFNRMFRQIPSMKRTYERHKDFEKRYYKLSRTVTAGDELKELLSSYDVVLVGSDQVWNSRFNGNDGAWYADWDGLSSVRFVSYAASAGDPAPADVERVLSSVGRFEAVSVREESLREKLDDKAVTVADPVILASPELWDRWTAPLLDGKYVLVYQGRSDDSVLEIAKGIAGKYGAEVVVADNYMNGFVNGVRHVEVGPDGFVSLVKNAMCVITTSFHGAAVSIVSQTPFYVVRLDDGADMRAEELLTRFGLDDRMIAKSSRPDVFEMDFSASVQKIEEQRGLSNEFLINALELCR